MDDFRRLLGDLVSQFGGSKQAFARAVGITPSHLSHLLTDTNGDSVPSTEVCLRIAHASHANPSRVLRLAGKSEIADLLENLYGAAAERRQTFLSAGPHLSPADERYLGYWKHLSTKDKRALVHILDRFVTQAVVAAPGPVAIADRRRKEG